MSIYVQILFKSVFAIVAAGAALAASPAFGGIRSGPRCELSTLIDWIRESQAPLDAGLHTDLLQKHFGPVTLRVLDQSPRFRTVNIGTKVADGMGRLLTQAYSSPNPAMPPELALVHREIAAGGSMGKTFKAHGFKVLKRPIYEERVLLPEGLRKGFGTPSQTGVLRIYRFEVEGADGRQFSYSTVGELDAPDVTARIPPELRLGPSFPSRLNPDAIELLRYAHQQLRK